MEKEKDKTTEESKETANEEKGARVRKGIKYLKVAIFLLIIVGIPLFVYFQNPEIIQILTDRDALSAFLAANQSQNAIIYLVIQVIQVVISVIPGQIIQFAGGLIFGVGIAFALSLLGAAIGMFIAFNLARHFGKEFVIMIFKEKNVNKFVEMMDSSKTMIVIVLVYLIPGLPKDVFTYAAGLTKFNSFKFTLIATISRSPAMFATILLANFLRVENFIGAGIVVVVIAALLILLLVKRKQVFGYIENLHKKISGTNTEQ